MSALFELPVDGPAKPATQRGAALLEGLNPRQRQAVTHAGSPLLIVAGAGSGKTRVLTHRIAWLLAERHVHPGEIMSITFTNKAAAEMKARVDALVGRRANAMWVSTFHSMCVRILRREAKHLGVRSAFSIYDADDTRRLVGLVVRDLDLDPKKFNARPVAAQISNLKNELLSPDDAAERATMEYERRVAEVYALYQARLRSANAFDFDDLIMETVGLLQAFPDVAEYYRRRFRHILVDEYQDTNVLQAQILERLRPDGKGLTVVGDDAQAIYSFRAATVENIRGFASRFSSQVVSLEDNYRSTQAILDAANALIGKRLRSIKGAGAKPRHVTVADDAAQANYVVTHILERRERGTPLKRQAVLFRSSHHSDVLELELVRRNIPYVKYGGLKFLEAAHVKDLLSVLRWADNPRNRIAAFRALQLLPGVGPATAQQAFTRFEIAGWASLAPMDAALAQLMTSLCEPEAPWAGQVARVREWYEPHLERIYEKGDSQAQARAADLVQLERLAPNFPSREKFLTELALDPPAATGDLSGDPHLDEDYLVLSTVHSAKGQEWDAVYVLNVNDGSFPSEFSTGAAELIEEEKRLLYVAMTRAKSDLDLIAPLKYYVTQQSRMGDRHVYGAKSRFLTKGVMACLEERVWDEIPALDVGKKLRAMW
jgi:DNA helicase-2/ATP-dependent DNA helicase PcrA